MASYNYDSSDHTSEDEDDSPKRGRILSKKQKAINELRSEIGNAFTYLENRQYMDLNATLETIKKQCKKHSKWFNETTMMPTFYVKYLNIMTEKLNELKEKEKKDEIERQLNEIDTELSKRGLKNTVKNKKRKNKNGKKNKNKRKNKNQNKKKSIESLKSQSKYDAFTNIQIKIENEELFALLKLVNKDFDQIIPMWKQILLFQKNASFWDNGDSAIEIENNNENELTDNETENQLQNNNGNNNGNGNGNGNNSDIDSDFEAWSDESDGNTNDNDNGLYNDMYNDIGTEYDTKISEISNNESNELQTSIANMKTYEFWLKKDSNSSNQSYNNNNNHSNSHSSNDNELVSALTSNPFSTNVSITDVFDDANNAVVHLYIQQRNGRKYLTLIKGLSDDLDIGRIIKHIKKTLNTNGTIKYDDDLQSIIQFQGDQRDNIFSFLVKYGICKENEIIKHGF